MPTGTVIACSPARCRILMNMSRLFFMPALLFLCMLPARAQTGTAPTLTKQPYAPYPEDARKAHVTGEAIVNFSIDPAGKPTKVHAVSGPAMLTSALQAEISRWRFVTPLPRDAEKDFVADYTYSIIDPDKPAVHNDSKRETEDADEVPEPIAAVAGVVHSVNQRQFIDSTPLIKSERVSSEEATPR